MSSKWMWAWLTRTVGIALFSGAFAHSAHAHESPRVHDVLAGEASSLVLITNRGLIFGDRDSARYRLLCNEAMQINTSEVANAAIVPDGSLVLSTSTGVLRTRDEGCTFERVAPLETTNTPALAQDPNDASKLYAAAFGAGVTGIYASDDGGETFEQIHAASDQEFYEELLVAPSRSSALYSSGFSFDLDGGPNVHFIDRSVDSGAAFERFTIELAENESDFTLLAISPDDDRLVLGYATDNNLSTRMDRLLVSRDGGETWQSPIAIREISDAGFTGGKVWISGALGIFRSDDDAASFEPIEGPQLMSCIDQVGEDSLVCGRYAMGENGIARIDPGSGEMTAWMSFTQVTSEVSCEGESDVEATCAFPWRDWQNEILLMLDAGVASDGGTHDAGAMPDAGATLDSGTTADTGVLDPGMVQDRDDSGCSCGVIGPRSRAAYAPAAWLLVAALVFVRRSCRVFARGRTSA